MSQPSLVSSSTNILTLQDVVLDSPVWRANVLHLQDQIDLFEKWLEGFTKALKSYIESIVKHNIQASNLCKKTLLTGLDGTLIDHAIAGNVVTRFATTLQFTIAYKTKMASDLEDTLLAPLQNLVRHDLKTFKDTRKQFEKALDRYESQLNRYYVLSKQKEASALREDAFQMYELRKSHARSSVDYFSMLVSFKTNLEQLLVSCFSDALGAYIQDIDESAAACDHVRTKLNGWKQWIDESKLTSEHQLAKINNRCLELQDAYIQKSKPNRSLKRYSTVSDNDSDNNDPVAVERDPAQIKGEKQGYLNCRIMTARNRTPWTRRWFFLQHGWFGTCTVSTVQKERGCILVNDRVRMSEATFRVFSESDRRFCFDLIHPKYTFHLQAETEQEMQEWLLAMEYSKDMPDDEQDGPMLPQALLSPRANMSNRLNNKNNLTLSDASLISMSNSPLPSPKLEANLSTTTSSLTCLMIREGQTMAVEEMTVPEVTNTNRLSHQLSSWGMPWLSTGINAFSNTDDDTQSTMTATTMNTNTTNNNTTTTTINTNNTNTLSNTNHSPFPITTPSSSSTTNNTQQQEESSQLMIWPTKLELDAPKPTLSRYSSHLEESQRELRRYFDHVPEEETVLESFIASFYPSAEGYSGKIYLTQSRIWFYSCTFMTCVHTVIIPLSAIKSVYLENTRIVLETESDSFSFGLWLASPATTILEKVKYAVEHHLTMELDSLYDALRRIHPPKRRQPKIPTSHVTTTTSNTLYTSITPITVQAQQQQPIFIKPTASTSTSNTTDEDTNSNTAHPELDEMTPSSLGASFHNSPAQGALAAVAAKSNQHNNRKSVLKSNPEPIPTLTESAVFSVDEWPANIPKPQGKVTCNCKDHLEKVEADLVLDISPKALFDLLFSQEEGTLWHALNKAKGNSQPTLSPWQQQERVLQYVMPISNPMIKVKEADVIETQRIVEQQPYLCYVVMVTTKTPQLLYADAFVPSIKYCITYVSPTQSRLVCSMGVEWLKSIFVKGMVNRAAMKGMQETVNGLVSIIQQQVSLRKVGHKEGSDTTPKQPSLSSSSATHSQEPAESSQSTKVNRWPSVLTLILCFLCILSTVYQLYVQHKYQALVQQQESANVSWRGVYLRDLEEQVTQRESTLTRIHHSVYALFKEAKESDVGYQWTSKQHRMMAADISIMKEKLGVLRFELLSSFRVLNLIERQLLENEYDNWVADQLIECQNDTICQLLKAEIN